MNTLIKKISVYTTVAVAVAAPQVAGAQFFEENSFEGFLGSVEDVINALIPILSGLALIAFFFGLAMYVFNADDEEKKKSGKQTMIAGIVALFLMAAIGGIISFLTEATGTDDGNIDIENPIRN